MVIERSAAAITFVVAVALLFVRLSSAVAEVVMAVFESSVPAATAGLTATVKANTALPRATLGLTQAIVPAAPTAGVVHDQPAIAGSETKAVPTGKVSLHDAVAAAAGPLLVTVMV